MKMHFLIILSLVLLTACSAPAEPMDTANKTEEMAFQEKETPQEEKDPKNLCEHTTIPSLQALICNPVQGSNLSLRFVETENSSYTRYAVSYEADGLTLSGVLLIPKGEGPFPLVLTNHGYIDTAVYTRGRGLKREQDALARAGFAVLHPDYRNHAESDEDPNNSLQFRLGYVQDVIGGITAIQSSKLPELQVINADRVGIIGHSMGGGVSLQVAVIRPDLVDALVLYAPVSAEAVENLKRYFMRRPNRSEVVQQLFEAYGSPEENPAFWEGLSASNMLDRLETPVQIYIGTADESVEPQWSYDIETTLKDLGKPVELIRYDAAPHEFIKHFESFKEGFVKFFEKQLKN